MLVVDVLGCMGVDGLIENYWGVCVGVVMMFGLSYDVIGYLVMCGGNGNGMIVY